MIKHDSVLLKESIEGLKIQPDGVYIDVTFGGGGHSREILKYLNKEGRLIAFDQDSDTAEGLSNDNRFIFIRHNFRFIKNFCTYMGYDKVSGILADLGVSSHQFETPERGFSFRYEGPLDMRMNTSAKISAAAIINTYSKEELTKIFREYGELRSAMSIAQTIITARSKKAIETTQEFTEIISKHIPVKQSHKVMARIFQALRIEVNNEIGNLKALLAQTAVMLKPEGRLVIISYHSLEDRLVKHFMRTPPFKQIHSKVITPSEKEVSDNPRARSAKMRIAEHT